MVIKPRRDDLMKDYLFFALSGGTDLKGAISGSAQPQITQANLEPVVLLIPPLDEQCRIVEILNEQLSRLDTALESVSSVREKAAQFRLSLLYAAFTGRLTRGWREDFNV